MVGSRRLFSNNLPPPLTSFVGREREVAEVKRLLHSTHLLTLTGAGGCGKTRLALRVATDLVKDYPNGVCLVELAALSESNLVPHAVASALSVVEQPGHPLARTLVDSLRSESLLLLLDNCEHLLPACTQIADALLRGCPDLRILATSREGLRIAGEVQYPVPPLSVPDPQRVGSVEDLARYEAVQLFVERAVATQPIFKATAANAQAIAQLCYHLDGIPLAIELAAARVKVLAVEQIVARLDDRFGLLTGGSRTALPKHQTLRAAMDWSYDLLSESEAMLLRTVSVFAGGWTLEAAEAVCSGNGVESAEILDLLTQLAYKSLVVVEMHEGEARYRLLETVRQYGRDRLLELKESEKILGRHLDFFLGLAEEIEPKLEGAEQEVWVNRLEAEHDNLRAALEWSIKNTAESGLRLAGALGRFWLVRGHFTEGYRWLMEALKINGSPAQRAKALNGTGSLAARKGNYSLARSLHEESLAIYRELGDKRGQADAIYNLGRLAATEGDQTSARSLYDECQAIYRELGNEQGIADSISKLGHTVWHQGDYAAARTLLQEGLARSRKVGQGELIVDALYGLGLVAYDQHNYAEARSLWREGLGMAKELGDPFVAYLLEDFAYLAVADGQPNRATRLLAAASTFRRAIDFPLPLAHRSDYDRPLAAIHAALKEEAFQAAWAEGQTMTREQAIEYALVSSEPPRESKRTEKRAISKAVGLLTLREREVAVLIAQGFTNRKIASQLVISQRTVDGHVQHILNKLGLESRAQIAAWVVEHGLQTSSSYS